MQRTVLIVEDDRDLAGTLELGLLALNEVETVVVHDGRAAQEYLSANATPPAAVMTDLDLPRLDGFALIKWMRSQPKLLRVPVVAMSANQDGTEALAAGANQFVGKPYSLARIRECLQELLYA